MWKVLAVKSFIVGYIPLIRLNPIILNRPDKIISAVFSFNSILLPLIIIIIENIGGIKRVCTFEAKILY